MRVQLLKEGEFVIYRLIEADKISPNATDMEGGPVYQSPVRNLARMSRVFDIEKKQPILIGNVVELIPKTDSNGNQVIEEICKGISFTDGMIQVGADKNNTYQYLERHNANRDNIFRNPTLQAVYYRVDPRKKAIEETNKFDILTDALAWIQSGADAKEFMAINNNLPEGKKVDMNQSEKGIKAAFYKLAMEDPMLVMKSSSHALAILKITVMECERYNIILWDESDRKWFFNSEKVEDLVTVEIGTDRVAGLVEYLRTTEGRKKHAQLKNKLNMFLSIRQN